MRKPHIHSCEGGLYRSCLRLNFARHPRFENQRERFSPVGLESLCEGALMNLETLIQHVKSGSIKEINLVSMEGGSLVIHALMGLFHIRLSTRGARPCTLLPWTRPASCCPG